MHFMKDCLKGARSPSRRRRNDLHFPAIAFCLKCLPCFSSPQYFSLSSGFITCATRAKTVSGRSSVVGLLESLTGWWWSAYFAQIVCTLLVLIDKDQLHPLRDVDGLTSSPFSSHSPSFMVGTRISRLLSMPMGRKSCAAYRTLFCMSLSLTYWLISCQIYSHSHSYSHLHTC